MGIYITRRLLLAAVVVLGVSAVVFFSLRLSGDPAALMLPPDATRADYANLRHVLGLDQPVPVQYVRFLGRMVRGDLGQSFRYQEPATALVLERLPATGQLALTTLVIVVLLAVPLGVASAVFRGSAFDHVVSVLTLAGQSMPNYWFAIMLILVFAVDFRWLPTSGYGTLVHLVLPATALAAQPASRSVRFIRSEMLEILRQDYVRTARAKGIRPIQVLIGHALRNAAIPVVTLLGLDVGYLLGGAIVTETVFAWPGVGRLMVDAVSQRDFPVVQAATVFIACTVVAVNLVIDLSYVLFDPRVRLT